MADIEFIYNVSLSKLHNFQIARRGSDGLRKLVLLNNFVFKNFVSPEPERQDVDPLEWSEEDIKKDEQSWLDSCLNDLDEEDEDGYVYVNRPLEYQSTTSFPIDRYDDLRNYEDHYIQDKNSIEYDQHSHERLLSNDKVIDDVIIPHDLLHLPFFESGACHMIIDDDNDLKNTSTSNDDSSHQQDYDVDMTEVESFSENLTCEEGFHPYWKDNSIIAKSQTPLKKTQPFRPYFDLNTCSFGIPKIFHKYRLGQDDSAPPFILELLQSDPLYQSLEFPHYEPSLKRSKDDLDILYSFAPRDLDKGALISDMISMLEYYGKTNHNNGSQNSSEMNDIWFCG